MPRRTNTMLPFPKTVASMNIRKTKQMRKNASLFVWFSFIIGIPPSQRVCILYKRKEKTNAFSSLTIVYTISALGCAFFSNISKRCSIEVTSCSFSIFCPRRSMYCSISWNVPKFFSFCSGCRMRSIW